MAFSAGVFAGALVVAGGAAGAQEVDTYEQTPPPQVIDDEVTNPPTDVGGDEVEGDEVGVDVEGDEVVVDVEGDEVVAGEDVAVAADTQTLPVTGGDVVGLAALGAGAIVAGSAALLYRRRRLA